MCYITRAINFCGPISKDLNDLNLEILLES